jgi:hypothetical protein
LPPGRRKTTPPAEVRTPDLDLNQNGVVCDMSLPYLDFYVGQRPHQLLVEQTDSVSAAAVVAPGLIIVSCSIAEGAKNTFRVMLVLQSNVLLDNLRCEPTACFPE